MWNAEFAQQQLERAALVPTAVAGNPILHIGGDQLLLYVHSVQSVALFTLPGRDVEFVLGRIYPYQIGSHRQSYVNACLIQSRGRKLRWDHICDRCATMDSMSPFPSCRRAYGHFEGACANCKWPDYGLCCSLRNVADGNVAYDDNGPGEGPYRGNQLPAPEPAPGTAERPLLLDAPPGETQEDPLVLD